MLAYVSAAIFLWILWKLTRNYIVRGPLAGLPGPPRSSFITGNMSDLFSHDGWNFHLDIPKYGPVATVTGMFGKRWLYVCDPTALNSILVKDHDSWDENSWILDSYNLLLGPGLLSVHGEMHRKQRKMLTPLFSPSHLRNITPILHRVARNLVQAISSRVDDGPTSIDVFSWMRRVALESIGQSGLGYSFDPLIEDVEDEYLDAVNDFIPSTAPALVSMLRLLAQAAQALGLKNKIVLRKAVDAIPWKKLRRLTQVVHVLDSKSKEIFEAKKLTVKERGADGGMDIMTVLLRANMAANDADKLPEDQLIAQMSTILFAGKDTVSSALARALQLLAEHPDVQDKLRAEVQEASRGEEMAYDELQKLPYLDAICKETLRLYSPITFAFREAVKDTVIPLSEPLRARDGTLINEVLVPRGTNAVIGVMARNRDKTVWGEDAEEWKPERWMLPLRPEVEKAKIPGVYSHLMTFLGGNRACIGFMLAQLEMKLVLSTLVQKFAFERGSKSIVWNLYGVCYPSASRDSQEPELWLNIRNL